MKKVILMVSCVMMLIVASCSQEPGDTNPGRPNAWDGTISRPEGVPDNGIIAPGTINVGTAAELAYIGHTVNGTLKRSESYTEGARSYDVEADTNKSDWQKAQDAQTLKGVKIVITDRINLFNNDGTLFPMIGRLLRTTGGTSGSGGIPNTIVGAPEAATDEATVSAARYTARAGTPFAGKFDGNGQIIEGLNLNLPEVAGVALFGFIADGAVVADFTLLNPTVVGNGYVGGVVGRGTGLKWNTSTASGNITPDADGGGSTTANQAGTGPGYGTTSPSVGEGGTQASENMSPALVAKIIVENGSVTGGDASWAWEAGNAQPMGGVAGLNVFVDYAFVQTRGTRINNTGNGAIGVSGWVAGVVACVHNGQFVFAFNNGTVNGDGAGSTVGGVSAHTISAGADPRATTSGGTGYTNVFNTDTHAEFNNPMVFGVFNQGTVTRNGGGAALGGVLGLQELGTLRNSLSIGAITPTTGANVGQLAGTRNVGNFGDNFFVPNAIDMPSVPLGTGGLAEYEAQGGTLVDINNPEDINDVVVRMNTQDGQGGAADIGSLLRNPNPTEANVFINSGGLNFIDYYEPNGGWVVPGLD